MNKKMTEISKMNAEDLSKKLVDLKAEFSREFVKSKVGSKTEKVKNTRNIRKDIARVLTVMNKKQ